MTTPLYIVDAFTDWPFAGNPAAVCLPDTPRDTAWMQAHCVLAPYWCARLGRTRLTGFQASRRGGVVGVELAGDRVRLTGQAVTIHSGALHV